MPNLTQPELMLLRESLSSEMMVIEKLGFLANQTTDPQFKQVLLDVQKTHQRHQDILMRHLGVGPVM